MKLKSLMLVAVLAAMFAGCTTVEMSSTGAMKDGKRMLVIRNNTYDVLALIPLLTGAAAWDEKAKDIDVTPRIFMDRTKADRLYELAKKVAQRENCSLEDVVYHDSYRGLELDKLYGLLFTKDVSISVVLKPNK